MAYPYASPATVGPAPQSGYPQASFLPAGAMPPGSAIGPAGENPFYVRPQDIYRPPVATLFHFDLSEAKVDYVVPQRFGLAAILGMTTALAILFGCMRWLDAEPGWYLFYGFQSVVICIVQMFHGKSPRRASAIAGAIMGPLFVLGTAWFTRWENTDGSLVLCFMVMMVPCGAFLGYLNGTCAAGIFLVMDKLEKYLKGDSASENEPERAASLARGARVMTAPPGVPVFNCVVNVAPAGAEGLVVATVANLAGFRGQGKSEREALASVVGQFKAAVDTLPFGRNEPIPWIDPPTKPAAGETQRLIAVHL